MLDITKDIQSLTTFRRRSGAFLKQLRKSKRPVVLTDVGVGRPTLEELVLSKRVPQFTLLRGTLYDGLKNLSSGPVPFAFGF